VREESKVRRNEVLDLEMQCQCQCSRVSLVEESKTATASGGKGRTWMLFQMLFVPQTETCLSLIEARIHPGTWMEILLNGLPVRERERTSKEDISSPVHH
jgi:hypothetical protein